MKEDLIIIKKCKRSQKYKNNNQFLLTITIIHDTHVRK